MPDHELQNCQNRSNCTCCLFDYPLLSYLLPPVLILIFVLGSIFNGIALYAFCFHIKSWNSSTVYLFNLSVADILLIICLPFRTDYYLKQTNWVYGDVTCRVILFMLAMNRAGSIFFLTLVGLDRYFRVVHPYSKINFMSIKAAIIIACVVWLVTISLTVFILTKDHTGGNTSSKSYCDSFMVCPAALYWNDLLFIIEFFLPLCFVLFCSYSIIWRLRQRNLDKYSKIRKAVKCIMLVGVMFFMCFLPSVCTRIEILRLLASPQRDNCSVYGTIDIAFYITICLTYMNSMCNPLLYYFTSPSFRMFYFKIMRCPNPLDSESGANIGNNNNLQSNNQLQSHME